MLKIYNTLTRCKEQFQPLGPPRVTFYNCGPTVYDHFHIGNARNFVVADVIRRYLKFKNYQLTFVQNITDIDDKIIKRANEEGRPTAAVVEQFTRAYFDHLDRLGIEPPDLSPRATDHIPQMIAFIERLIETGFAYVVEGDVYFRVAKFPDYGKLSRKKIEELHEGKRVEVDSRKEDPKDFDLWKAAKPGEPTWPSPWGPGRPGWHIECSTMAVSHLGETIDIHSGGSDLQFPHHENEIAQSEAATGKPFVRYWIHNAFLNIGGEKMSKSLGNFVTIDQVLAHYDPMVVRYFFLSAHYRRPMDYGPESLDEARKALARLAEGIETVEKVLALIARGDRDGEPAALAEEDRPALAAVRERFGEFMDDDFNTPRALSVLFDAVTDLHEKRRQFEDPKRGARLRAFARAAIAQIRELAAVLGLDLSRKAAAESAVEPLLEVLAGVLGDARCAGATDLADRLIERMAQLGYAADGLTESPRWRTTSEPEAGSDPFAQLIDLAIEVRNQARRAKRFEIADRIRAALGQLGILLEDYRSGTIWKEE